MNRKNKTYIKIDNKWYRGSDTITLAPQGKAMNEDVTRVLNNVAEQAKIERRYAMAHSHYVFSRYGVDGSPINRAIQIVDGVHFDHFVEDIEKHEGFTVEDGGLVQVLFDGNLHDVPAWHICKDGFIGDEQ